MRVRQEHIFDLDGEGRRRLWSQVQEMEIVGGESREVSTVLMGYR